MKIVIVGAGALGRLFGVFLARAGEDVLFVEPEDGVVRAINEQGLGVVRHEAATQEVEYVRAAAVSSGREIMACDVLLLAVKSHQVREAVRDVVHLARAETPIVPLVNGLGHLEEMEQLLGRARILPGFTLMAATAFGPGLVDCDGSGPTVIGEYDGKESSRLMRLCEILNRCGIVTEAAPDVISRIWCKAIVHAAINPVAALVRQRNGHLVEGVESISLMKRLVDEGREIAEACGVALGGADLYRMLHDACRTRYDHLSPMLQDIINGRQTEIDSLSGILYRYGRQHGIEAVTHLTMFELVRALEKSGGLQEQQEERF